MLQFCSICVCTSFEEPWAKWDNVIKSMNLKFKLTDWWFSTFWIYVFNQVSQKADHIQRNFNCYFRFCLHWSGCLSFIYLFLFWMLCALFIRTEYIFVLVTGHNKPSEMIRIKIAFSEWNQKFIIICTCSTESFQMWPV